MNVIQALLTIVFLLAGSMKLIQPKERLVESMQWVEGIFTKPDPLDWRR